MRRQGLTSKPNTLVSRAPPVNVKRPGAAATNACGRQEHQQFLAVNAKSHHNNGHACSRPLLGPPQLTFAGATQLAARLVVMVASTRPNRAAAMPHTPSTRLSRAIGSLMALPNSTTVAAGRAAAQMMVEGQRQPNFSSVSAQPLCTRPTHLR